MSRSILAIGLVLELALIGVGVMGRPASTAVCGSDADCAAWEVRHHIPADERCYGAPCAPKEVK